MYSQPQQPRPKPTQKPKLVLSSWSVGTAIFRLAQVFSGAAGLSALATILPVAVAKVIAIFILLFCLAVIGFALYTEGDQSVVLSAVLAAVATGCANGAWSSLMAIISANKGSSVAIACLVLVLIGVERWWSAQLKAKAAAKAAREQQYGGYYPAYPVYADMGEF